MEEMRYDEFCHKVSGSPEVTQYKRALDATGRFDAAVDTGLIARALLYVKKTIYNTKYPMLKARDLIPVANDAPAGADSISSLIWDQVGQAKIISNHADDLPRVDALLNETITPVRSLGDAYAYSHLDLLRAAMSGQPLQTQKAKAAARGIEQSIEDIAAVGDTDTGLAGALNNSSVTIDAATGAWTGLTPVEILADLARIQTNMLSATSQSEMFDTIVLPTSLYALVAQTPFSSLNGQTILSVYKQYNPYITNIEQWVKLNTAGAGGIARIWAYRKDPEVLTLDMPLEFTQLPPEPRNLEFIVNCWARTGGVTVRYPLAMRYMDGA